MFLFSWPKCINPEETRDNLKLTFHSNWPVCLKNAKVTKEKKTLKNCARLKEIKEVIHLIATPDPGLDPDLYRKLLGLEYVMISVLILMFVLGYYEGVLLARKY